MLASTFGKDPRGFQRGVELHGAGALFRDLFLEPRAGSAERTTGGWRSLWRATPSTAETRTYR